MEFFLSQKVKGIFNDMFRVLSSRTYIKTWQTFSSFSGFDIFALFKCLLTYAGTGSSLVSIRELPIAFFYGPVKFQGLPDIPLVVHRFPSKSHRLISSLVQLLRAPTGGPPIAVSHQASG
ncbi:hypothetical protein HAX54_005005 [Datura stramonium]|uniref:Uncharacterized protein n=1 Tax=Datura stramonium TaxID=4076 RepID=A0ABS8RUH5_DATST|nr:hypothetical protein [Datura stramonium]